MTGQQAGTATTRHAAQWGESARRNIVFALVANLAGNRRAADFYTGAAAECASMAAHVAAPVLLSLAYSPVSPSVH